MVPFCRETSWLVKVAGELGQDLPSHPHGVGVEVVRGVEHQDPGRTKPGELEGQHPLGQLPDPAAVGLLPTQAKLGRQDVLVIEGPVPSTRGLPGKAQPARLAAITKAWAAGWV